MKTITLSFLLFILPTLADETVPLENYEDVNKEEHLESPPEERIDSEEASLNLASPTNDLGLKEYTLTSKDLDLGALNQETNAPANEIVLVKRTAQTPNRVKVTFSLNYMKKKCVEYETKQEDIPEFSQVVCEKGVAEQHICEKKEYSGFFNAKTSCTKQGLVRESAKRELILIFDNAVKLTPRATEVFQVNLKQKRISSTRFFPTGKAIDTASLYKIHKGWRNTLKFKRK